MVYVFDTNIFIVISHYFPDRFPSFWENINTSVASKEIISVREVRKELENRATKTHLIEWLNLNKHIFAIPSAEEMDFVQEIFTVRHFQQLVAKKNQLKGTPVADPFVIASAKIYNGCVVTEEANKKGAAKIPNVCDHFNVNWTNLEGFMEQMKWRF